jgi:hypothetical protein
VTPDNEAPIIPKATRYQGDCLLAVKKVLLSAFLEVKYEMRIRSRKYPDMTERTSEALMKRKYG